MAEVVSSFLVGLGYKVDKRSEQAAVDSIRSSSKKAVQAGTLFGRSFDQKPVTAAISGAASSVLGMVSTYATAAALTAKNTKKSGAEISESVETDALVDGFGQASVAADKFATRFGAVAKRATQTGATLAGAVTGGAGLMSSGMGSVVAGAGALSAGLLGVGAGVAAVAGGALAVKSLADNFSTAQLAADRFAQTYGVAMEDVVGLGRVMEVEGGTQEAVKGQLAGLERMRAGLMVGDAEWISTAGRAGIDTSGIESARDSVQAYLSLADQFQRMSTKGRLNAAEALGLDDAAIRLLSRGRGEIEKLMNTQLKQRKITEEMTVLSAAYASEMHELGNNFGALADTVAVSLLPRITSFLAGLNSISDSARMIPEQIGRARSFAGEVKDRAASVVSKAVGAVSSYLPSVAGITSGYTVSNMSTSTTNNIVNQQPSPLRPQNINLNATIELDGRAIGNKILQVVNDQNEIAMTNLSSSVAM